MQATLNYRTTYIQPEKKEVLTKVENCNSSQPDSLSSVKLPLRTNSGINTVNSTFGLCVYSRLNYSGNMFRSNMVIFKPLSNLVETRLLKTHKTKVVLAELISFIFYVAL
jgi:hypothetical protein